MNVLFVCTSNKDRSPALEKYFREKYPNNGYSSAGINKYFCDKKETHFINISDLLWADLLVFAEDIHERICHKKIQSPSAYKNNSIILNCGEYEQGNISDDYLRKSEDIILKYCKSNKLEFYKKSKK